MHPAIAALEALPPLPPETWTWLAWASTATHLAAEVALDAAEQDRLETFVLEKVDGGATLPGPHPGGPPRRDTSAGSSGGVD